MTNLSIYTACRPRPDVLASAIAEADFAADLAGVIRGRANPEYSDPARFFVNTYPTQGLKNLLANVAGRLSGAGDSAAAIFRLDTSYGGGKTHGLIALPTRPGAWRRFPTWRSSSTRGSRARCSTP